MTVRPDELRNNFVPGAPVTRGAEPKRVPGDRRPVTNPAGRRPLTPRQATVLALVQRYERAVEEPVPVRYLARRLGMSPGGARAHLVALRKKHYLPIR